MDVLHLEKEKKTMKNVRDRAKREGSTSLFAL
jgi:hypothetical protein